MSDLIHHHASQINVLRVFHPHVPPDGHDLIAIGGEHSVEIIQTSPTACKTIALFHIGIGITALAWSSRTASPATSDDWLIELAVASADFGLYLLTKSSITDEHIFSFGGGLSGHHGRVNDMSFCGGRGDDSYHYIATVSDDKMLMIWDLYPDLGPSSAVPLPSSIPETKSTPPPKRQPTAYVIPFVHPLTTVNSHSSTSKEFLVSDCRGSIFLTDWRSDPEDRAQSNWRHSSLVEFVEPTTISAISTGLPVLWGGSVAWRSDIIAASFGSKFSLWKTSNLQGGKPYASGTSFTEGGRYLRWCHTYPEYFAISSLSPLKGAVLHVHNIKYVHAQPTVVKILPRPHRIQDFDFLTSHGIPRIAAAIGRKAVIFPIVDEA